MFRGSMMMLDDWEALVLVDQSYEAQSLIHMDKVHIPLKISLLRSKNQ